MTRAKKAAIAFAVVGGLALLSVIDEGAYAMAFFVFFFGGVAAVVVALASGEDRYSEYGYSNGVDGMGPDLRSRDVKRSRMTRAKKVAIAFAVVGGLASLSVIDRGAHAMAFFVFFFGGIAAVVVALASGAARYSDSEDGYYINKAIYGVGPESLSVDRMGRRGPVYGIGGYVEIGGIRHSNPSPIQPNGERLPLTW